jgi:hypothetical protein
LGVQGLRKISEVKRGSRESLLDNKCLMLKHIKKNFYQVEFERNLGGNFYGEVSKLKIADWQASLEKKGAISRKVPFREMPMADDKTNPQIFDYGSVQNSYDRLLILKRLNDGSMAYKNKVTGLNERKYKNDADILARFTKFYNLREILANRKKLMKLRIEERKLYSRQNPKNLENVEKKATFVASDGLPPELVRLKRKILENRNLGNPDGGLVQNLC